MLNTRPRQFQYQVQVTPPTITLGPATATVDTGFSVPIVQNYTFQYQAFAIPPEYPIIHEDVFAWRGAWPDYLRTAPRSVELLSFLALSPFVQGPPEVVTVDKWFHLLTEPTRYPADLRAPRQQAFFAEPRGMTQPEAVLYSKFAYQWSEPVRFQPRLATGLHQVLALHPAPSPFVPTGWYNWLTEPVRFPPRLQTGLQQTTAFHPLPFVSYGWNQSLSEPVRFPPRLRPGLNLFNSMPTPRIPIPGEFGIEGWYNWWSEPVRFPQGLKTYLQQTTAMPPRLLPTPDIVGVMAAFDTPDTFLAAGSSFSQVANADVGIIELSGMPATAGIIEITQLSANVGQVSPITDQQSGTATTPSSAANVSIREI